MQAQVEPHFLFNTLASRAVPHRDRSAGANRMLDQLIALPAGGAAAFRAQATTLGREVELVRAYLDILAMRMGRGSHSSSTCRTNSPAHPVSAEAADLAGRERDQAWHRARRSTAGRYRSSARREGDSVVLTVTDTGRGLAASAAASGRDTDGDGVGLSNVQGARWPRCSARVRASRSSDLPPRGARAIIAIPHESR